MNIEQQVCTSVQGERIEELLGGDVKSYFQWIRVDGRLHVMPTDVPEGFKFTLPDLATTYYGPAFTVAELGVTLPYEVRTYKWSDGFGLSVESPLCHKIDLNLDVSQNLFKVYDTEAEARAAMLIYLLENNLCTAEEVNKRLNKSQH